MRTDRRTAVRCMEHPVLSATRKSKGCQPPFLAEPSAGQSCPEHCQPAPAAHLDKMVAPRTSHTKDHPRNDS